MNYRKVEVRGTLVVFGDEMHVKVISEMGQEMGDFVCPKSLLPALGKVSEMFCVPAEPGVWVPISQIYTESK